MISNDAIKLREEIVELEAQREAAIVERKDHIISLSIMEAKASNDAIVILDGKIKRRYTKLAKLLKEGN